MTRQPSVLILLQRHRQVTMLIRDIIFWLSSKRSITDSIARRGMKNGFARRFVAGETLAEALTASDELCRQGRNVSLNHLGENVSTEKAAREVCDSYIEMIEALHRSNIAGNISIKLTQLGLDLGKDFCATLALSIAKHAADLRRTIEIDMEGGAYTDATLDIFEGVQRKSASHRKRSATPGAAQTKNSLGERRVSGTQKYRTAGQACRRCELQTPDYIAFGRCGARNIFPGDCFARSDDGFARAG